MKSFIENVVSSRCYVTLGKQNNFKFKKKKTEAGELDGDKERERKKERKKESERKKERERKKNIYKNGMLKHML